LSLRWPGRVRPPSVRARLEQPGRPGGKPGAGVVGSYQEPPLMVADRTAVVQDRGTAREGRKKSRQTVVPPSSLWYLRGITIIRVVGIKSPEPGGRASRGVPRP